MEACAFWWAPRHQNAHASSPGRQRRGLGSRLDHNEPGSSVVGAGSGGGEPERVGFGGEGFGRADRVAGACTSASGPRGARADGDLLAALLGALDGDFVAGAVAFSPGRGNAEPASTPPSMVPTSAAVYIRPPTATSASTQVSRRFRRPLRSTKIACSWVPCDPPRR